MGGHFPLDVTFGFLWTLCFRSVCTLSHSVDDGFHDYRPDEGVPDGAVSLAFVLDVTGSMHDDLAQVAEGLKRILNLTLDREDARIYRYVLVPFHDPGEALHQLGGPSVSAPLSEMVATFVKLLLLMTMTVYFGSVSWRAQFSQACHALTDVFSLNWLILISVKGKQFVLEGVNMYPAPLHPT